MRSIKQYYNYSVIGFSSLIAKTNLDVINYYHDNNNQLSKINRDFKKIFVHFFVQNLCSECLNAKSGNTKILFCNPGLLDGTEEIFEYVNKDEYIEFVRNILEEINDVFPITVFESITLKYEDISETDKSNELRFLLDVVHARNKKKSIQKLMKYADGLGLNLIRKDYLESLNLRKIFI